MKTDEVYYQALDTFRGNNDMFWRQELYTVEEIEENGFFVEELLDEGKITLWEKIMVEYNDEHPITSELINHLRNAIKESNGKDVILDFAVAVTILELLEESEKDWGGTN
ncbi:Uncharacterised protein [Mycobacteroides abscessus subsp. abscessus]|nr:Uncharacterised protein [Mycobacteroides abscessus subsp. abscessus]